MSPSEAGALFDPLLKLDTFNTISFVTRLKRISTDSELLSRFKSSEAITRMASAWDYPIEYTRASKAAGLAIANAVITATASEPELSEVQAGFGHLSALLNAAGYGEVLVGDVYAFERAYDRVGFAETIKGLIGIVPVNPGALRAEALAAAPRIQADDEGWLHWTLDLPDVDLPKPEWSNAAALDLDDEKLIAALSHGSAWVVPVTAQLLKARARLSLKKLQDMLESATGYTLWAAAYLTHHLAGEDAAPMLLRVSKTRRVQGIEYVVGELAELNLAWSAELQDALRSVLLGSDAAAATAAALLLARRANAEPLPAELMCEAFAHWLESEEPYPKGGGTVPTSPRAHLVEAMIGSGSIDTAQLIRHVADDRPDVRKIAVEGVKQALKNGKDVEVVANAALGGNLEPSLIRDLIRESPALRSDWRRLAPLARNNSAAIRLATVPLFPLDDPAAAAEIRHLAEDDHPEVAEAAKRALAAGSAVGS
jgi:hypothetical protein